MTEEGYEYGELALKICDLFKHDVWVCRVSAGFYGTTYGWKHSVKEVIEPLQVAYRAGLRTGDIEYSIVSTMCHVNAFVRIHESHVTRIVSLIYMHQQCS